MNDKMIMDVGVGLILLLVPLLIGKIAYEIDKRVGKKKNQENEADENLMEDFEDRLEGARRVSRIMIVLFFLDCLIMTLGHFESRRMIGFGGLLMFSSNIYNALRYGLIFSLAQYEIKGKSEIFWPIFGMNVLFIVFIVLMMIFLPVH